MMEYIIDPSPFGRGVKVFVVDGVRVIDNVIKISL
jgi:hypothetical protein